MSSAASGAPRETKHAMKLRHKAELKALMAAPAKGIGAKKAQKDAVTAMEAKQAAELVELERREQAEKEAEENASAGGATAAAEPATGADGEVDDELSTSAASPPAAAVTASKQPSRAQQKKAKAAQKDKERAAQLREETSGMRDLRGEENAAIAKLLASKAAGTAAAAPPGAAPAGWRVKEIVSDGHCLYRALADQARTHHLWRDLPLNDNVAPFMQMRQLCAQYMRAHRDEFAPFMLTDEGDPLDDAGWAGYLRSLESEQEAVWGGHTEIVALSKAMRRPVRVWSADGLIEVGEEFAAPAAQVAADASSSATAAAPSPKSTGGAAESPLSPDADHAPLNISFHKHYYGLGNHYNAIEAVEEEEQYTQQGGASRSSDDKSEAAAAETANASPAAPQ